ncbi:MAG TPA: hypothetical protein VF525_10995 [Pyrinomonadaceae bacterium]|jgi:hypothetical protein
MINILSSDAIDPSRLFKEAKRKADEDNLQWLSRNLPDGTGNATFVLVGGKTQTSLRLRIGQAHVRHDLMPSYWSHVMLLGKPSKNSALTPVYEISLEPLNGFGFPPPTNGMQKGRLSQYREAAAYPNIAVIVAPVPLTEVVAALDRFQKQRSVLDTVDLIIRWLSYVWGVSNSPNPLLSGLGIPSAAMLEVAIGAAGFDVTPGLESRSSCPEAIWQAAKWWHEYYEDQHKQGLIGAYNVEHRLE